MLLTYLRKELLSLFRDRNIVLYGLIVPVFLYPSLLFGITQIGQYIAGVRQKNKPRIAVADYPELASFLRRQAKGSLQVIGVHETTARSVREGELDLALNAARDRATCRLEYDSSRGSSVLALERVQPLLKAFARQVELRKGLELGVARERLEAQRLSQVNVADPVRSTRSLLSFVLPLVLVLMCSFGATYPALELTAGERERSTAETTILLPLARRQIALGKSLAVSCAAFLALLVNLGAMLFSAGPMLANLHGGAATLPSLAWQTLPLILCFGALLSVVFGNLFLLVGSYAKTYREAQAFVTPLQVVVMLPALATLLPGAELDAVTAIFPIYNAGLAFRQSLLDELGVVPVLLSLASLGLFSLICFRATVRRLSDTAYVLGFKDPDQLSEVHA